MRLTDLRVNHVNNPLGFYINPLSFSWKVADGGEAKRMAFARIRIFHGRDMVFDSGEDNQANSLDYRVDISLSPRTYYTWSVEVKADNGETAKKRGSFETGKMDEKWNGKWIAPHRGDENVQPILRRRFMIDAESAGKSARLYLCGLGVYEVYLNGEKVGDEYLAPGYHSYDFHLQVQTYDATKYLKAGENEIQIRLGDGWFKGRLGFEGGYTNLYGDFCCAIGELYVEKTKEAELVLCTDGSWEYRESPIMFSNIYDGEIYDARLEYMESASDFVEKICQNTDRMKPRSVNWKPVALREPEQCGVLGDRYSLPIIKKEIFEPIERIRTPKGENVLDFGQNLSGWVEFDCNLSEKMQIRLTASEILQDGCFYHDNLRTAKTEFTYISNGKNAHIRPHFTFYGFRYMKVEYFDEEGNVLTEKNPTDEEHFIAYHLRSDFDETGSIVTGNKKVNKLFTNAMWGQKGNFLDVPTDCPQRDERLGWTGDAQIFSETACYNMDMPAFYRKYLWDMRAEQSILDGSVPNVVPRLKRGMVAEHGSCPWADAAVVIPWNVYRYYGSKTLLQECYPGMKGWIDYERRREEALGGLHLIKDGFHFADWLALDNPQPGPFGATDPLYIASAYYYRCTKYVAEAAAVLGYKSDMEEYEKLAEEILAAIRERYFDENGLCICQTQTGSAIAIMFGLNPDAETRNAEGDRLDARVKANNGHLNTGFVGTSMLCPALTKTGHNKTAVDLLLNEEFPGWLYSVNLGATTIWERWDSVLEDGNLNPDGMNSLNHYSYGSIVAWMYGNLCGIRPTEPGFKKALIEPHADIRLGFAEAKLDTAAGQYRSKWICDTDGTVRYEVEVPFDANAELIVNGKKWELSAGIHIFRMER